jgi:type VI secretion system (T6SS) phospholipase Tle1-like effector
MAHCHVGTDDSDATAFSLSYDSDKHILDVSPTTSEFPNFLNTTIPIAEHDKPLPRRREETLDPRRYPSVIPPKHSSRTLVLCFDGTGDQFDADNSNIVQFVSLLKKDDSTKQLVYYQVRLFFVVVVRLTVYLCSSF